MNEAILPGDLGFFSTLMASGSLGGAARALGISTAAVSKRLAQMEARLGVVLVIRTTRRMGLTPEGELFLEQARSILQQIAELEQRIGGAHTEPRGLLRVNATLGFGRRNVAPAVSAFVQRYTEVAVQLQLSVSPPLLAEDTYDVCVRFGEPPEGRVIARSIAPNRRLLCAAPSYLARRGQPKTPQELIGHNCISIRQSDDLTGVWRLSIGHGAERATETVRIQGNLITNDGEIAVNWALDGHGIVMRAEWDVAQYLASGRLVQVLPQYETPEADIYAVYPERLKHSTRVRAFVDFLAQWLRNGHPGRSHAQQSSRAAV